MDIGPNTTTYAPASYGWLDSADGTQAVKPDTLDLASFVAEDLVADGHIVPGVVCGRITSSGLLGPYDNAATDGRQTAVGFLFEDVRIVAGKVTGNIPTSLLRKGEVKTNHLPVTSGAGSLDSAGRTDLAAHFLFRSA